MGDLVENSCVKYDRERTLIETSILQATMGQGSP